MPLSYAIRPLAVLCFVPILLLLVTEPVDAQPPVPSQPQATCQALVGGACYVRGAFTLSSYSPGAHHYQVCRSEDTTHGCSVVMSTSSASTFTVSGSHLPSHGARRAYRFRACDAAGACTLWSENTKLFVYLDSQGPSAPIKTATQCLHQSDGNCWVQGPFNVSITSPTDGGSGVAPYGYQVCRSHDSTGGHAGCNRFLSTSAGTSFPVSGSELPADGYRRAYYFRATDQVGNLGAWNSPLYVRVDRNAPTVGGDNASQSWFSARTLTVSAADAVGGAASNSGLAEVRYNWNFTLKSMLCTGTLISAGASLPVPEGDNTLHLCAVDNTGRTTHWSGGPYRVDSQPPTQPGPPTTTCLHQAEGCWVRGDFTLSFNGSTDVGSGLGATPYAVCRSQDSEGGHAGCQHNVTHTASTSVAIGGSDLPSDGFRRAYWLRTTDLAGLRSAWSAPLYVRVDRHAPTVSAAGASEEWFTSRTVTVSATDQVGGAEANSGIAVVAYSWNVPLKPFGCTGDEVAPGATLAVPDGDNTLYLCARDGTGRVTHWGGGPFRVDGTPPTVDSVVVSSPSWTVNDGSTYSITVKATEAGSGFTDMRALINLHGGNLGERRGLLAWRPDGYLWSADQVPCSGGGHASKHPTNHNPHTVTLVGCTTSLSGHQRTVTFEVLPNESFGVFPAINDVSAQARDLMNTTAWRFFDIDFATTQVAPVDDASVVHVELPWAIECGSDFNSAVTLENTGNTVWDSAGGYRLGTADGSDDYGLAAAVAALAPFRVLPGASHRFDIALSAPPSPSFKVADWTMVRDGGGAFGQAVANRVRVICQLSETNGAEVVGHSLPPVMRCGSSRAATVEVRNTGTSVWRPDHLIRLGSVGGADPLAGLGRVNLPAGVEVHPGQSHAFGVQLTAPATGGVVTTDWRMIHEWRQWFGDVAEQQVIVDCSDFAVELTAPRTDSASRGGEMSLGTLTTAQLPATVAFTVKPPETPGLTVSGFRVLSTDGPVRVELSDPGPSTVGAGLPVTALLEREEGSTEASPFRVTVAFDTEFGDTFQFDLVGLLLATDEAEVDSWRLTVDDHQAGERIDLQVSSEALSVDPTHTFTLRVHNDDNSETLDVDPAGILRRELTMPYEVESELSFGTSPFQFHVAAQDEATLELTFFFGPNAVSGPFWVDVEIRPENSFPQTVTLQGDIEILRPQPDPFEFEVTRVDTGDSVGHLGDLDLGRVSDNLEIPLELFNFGLVTTEVETIEASPVAGFEVTIQASPLQVGSYGNLLFGASLGVLDGAAPGPFRIPVSIFLGDGDFSTSDPVFIFYLAGIHDACAGDSECGPVVEVRDPLGDFVVGEHARVLAADEEHSLAFRVTNVGGADLHLGTTGLVGDSEFSILTDVSGEVLQPAGAEAELVLGFAGTGTAAGETYSADVILNSDADNHPYQFRVVVETKEASPLVVTFVPHPTHDGVASLPLASDLPLTGVLTIWNPTGETYWVKGLRARKTQGGPLAWTWNPEPPGSDWPSAKEVPPDNGAAAQYQGWIGLSGHPGDLNRPFAFAVTFDYSTDRSSGYAEHTLVVEGELEKLYNPYLDDLKPIDCEDPKRACEQAYCQDVEAILDGVPYDTYLCVSNALDVLMGCAPCAAGPVCWLGCLKNILDSLACPLTIDNYVDELKAEVLEAKQCFCLSEGTTCENAFFLGYEVLDLPPGASVEVIGSCQADNGSQPDLDVTQKATVTAANPRSDWFMHCPENSTFGLSTALVETVPGLSVSDDYPCRALDPGESNPAAYPVYSGVLTEQFLGRFDCGCPVEGGCGEFYDLVVDAEGLQPGDGLEVVINVHGLSVEASFSGTVTKNGPTVIQQSIVPLLATFTVALANQSDYPHCAVTPAHEEISDGQLKAADIRCDPHAPHVRIVSPAAGEVTPAHATGAVSVVAVAGDATGVREVRFLADDELIGTDVGGTTYQVGWTPTEARTYSLRAEVKSIGNGTRSSEPVEVHVTQATQCASDLEAPVVVSFWPHTGVVEIPGGHALELRAVVVDNQAVSRVDFFLDDAYLAPEGSNGTYRFYKQAIAEGRYSFTVIAYDTCMRRTVVTSEIRVVHLDPVLPVGHLSQADCEAIAGRSHDVSGAGVPVTIELHQASAGGEFLTASVVADDVCSADGLELCFSLVTPITLARNEPVQVHAYALDVDNVGYRTGMRQELTGSPFFVDCERSPLEPPD